MSKSKKTKKIKSAKEPKLIDSLAVMFNSRGYTIEPGSFDDGSASWICISKPEKPNIKLEISFNAAGTKFVDFNIWEEITDVVETSKLL